MELSGLAVAGRNEEALVTRAREGDRDAFALLIQPRTDRVLRTARAILANESDAHDAAQAAFVSAWVNLPRLRETARFDAWLTRVLVNECREALRRRKRNPEIVLDDTDLSGPDSTAGSVETAALRAAFGRVSVDERTILLLHHLHGLPLDQVARQLQIPVGTAKSRLWSARRALERALEAEA